MEFSLLDLTDTILLEGSENILESSTGDNHSHILLFIFIIFFAIGLLAWFYSKSESNLPSTANNVNTNK